VPYCAKSWTGGPQLSGLASICLTDQIGGAVRAIPRSKPIRPVNQAFSSDPRATSGARAARS
jgi:hypothetical protein